jgi:hypothetical protein
MELQVSATLVDMGGVGSSGKGLYEGSQGFSFVVEAGLVAC